MATETVISAAFAPELLTKTGDLTKYEQLCAAEPSINWLGWCAKLYKKSHAIHTVATRLRGAKAFRDYLQTENITLAQAFKKVKTKKDADKYRVFDDFSTYCDGIKGYAPNVTWAYVQGAKSLADYCSCGLNDDDFAKHVTMPTITQLNEEYPPNEIILRILDAASPLMRGFILTMCDAGLEPVDATKLQKNMIFFDETPVRLEFKRKKTAKPITQFLGEHTAQLLKTLCADKTADDYVFTETFNEYRVTNMRQMYNKAVKRAGLNEKIPGHKFGKYHMKIFKKRWFTLAISAGVPEYVAQAMLGRKKYLDQYMALPLDQKREFAKKILRKVALYAQPEDEAEKRRILAETLGLPELTDAQMQAIKGVFMRALEQPKSKILQEID